VRTQRRRSSGRRHVQEAEQIRRALQLHLPGRRRLAEIPLGFHEIGPRTHIHHDQSRGSDRARGNWNNSWRKREMQLPCLLVCLLAPHAARSLRGPPRACVLLLHHRAAQDIEW
jgi:hypothetical protein